MDMMLVPTIVPKTAADYLTGRRSISSTGGGVQIFFLLTVGGGECFLLAAMSYDHCVAICHPLRHPILMSWRLCLRMTWESWIVGSLDGIIVIIVALSFHYCGAWEIPHFFCDVPALLTLSCTNTLLFERLMFICCVITLLFPVAVITASYAHVLLAVIHMGSGESHHKAFATCSSHLMVVGMYYVAAMFTYMWPISDRSPTQDKMVSAFYTILTPMLNPLIYSLHNKEVARAFRTVLGRGKSGE
ncbi:Olfactory receptor 2M3 [Manis javanica]|nr:Olfactory receptor 2M3 [Manis javanica]